MPYPGLLTDRDGLGPNRRLRTDQGSTGFFAGREVRTWYEFSITGGTERIIKAVLPIDIILTEIDITITQGELKAYTLLSDGTEGGSFSTSLPILPANTMASRPLDTGGTVYAPVTTLTTGGTYTGGTAIDLVWLKTDANSNKALGVGASQGSERGVAAATYYYRLQAIGGTAATGIFKGRWEERPSGV